MITLIENKIKKEEDVVQHVRTFFPEKTEDHEEGMEEGNAEVNFARSLRGSYTTNIAIK